MQIALVTHNVTSGDGQGRVNLEVVYYLLSKGVKVTLLAVKVDPKLIDAGAKWIRVHPKSFVNAVDLIKVWRFRQMADRTLADIGDQFDAVLACGVTLSRPHTINAVHFVHGTWLKSPYHTSKVRSDPYGWYQWGYTALNARWELQTLRSANRIVAVSEMVRQELIDIGIPDDQIEVIMNGVDIQEFYPADVDRPSLGLPEDVVLGLFVGDLQSPIKNLDAVLHGMQEVPGFHLAVAGRLERSPYPRLARDLDIEERVHFLGFRRDIPDLMRAADFFALPSRRDSCPLVHLEAMASGLPTITTQTVGTSNLVNGSGFVMNSPEDHDTLVRSLRILSRDPEKRHEMGLQARMVAEDYSWQKMAQRYLSLLENCVS